MQIHIHQTGKVSIQTNKHNQSSAKSYRHMDVDRILDIYA